MAFGIPKKPTTEKVQFDKNGNRLVMGPGGKMIAAPKVKQPTSKGVITRPGSSTGQTGSLASSGVVQRPTFTSTPTAPAQRMGPTVNPGDQARFVASNTPTPTPGGLYAGGTGNGAPGTYGVNAASTGGAGTGGVGGTGGTDLGGALHGLAGSFTQEMLPYVYAQPELILQQLMKNNGQNPLGANSGLFTAGTPYMDNLMSLLPLAFNGGGPGDSSAGINWMGQMMQQGMTPGGAGPQFGDTMQALKNQIGNSTSAAAQYFTAPGMDPIDQFNKAKEVIYAAASMGLPPQFQQAMKNAMNSGFTRYMGGMTTGQGEGNFLPFFLDKDRGYMKGYM